MKIPRVVVSIGGSALLRRGQPMTVESQQECARKCAQSLAKLATEFHVVALTHGNGPQMGQLALERQAPLDVLVAETQGQIGHRLMSALEGVGFRATTVVTQVLISRDDPALEDPAKFLGPAYNEVQGKIVGHENHGWSIRADGKHYRRAVPSPAPLAIYQLDAIKHLSLQKWPHVVIACGGGGIPVAWEDGVGLVGVEATIDKVETDKTSALLASGLDADGLIILTDGGGIWEHYGQPNAREMARVCPEYLQENHIGDEFPWTMEPKIKACVGFVSEYSTPNTEKWAVIADLNDAGDIRSGSAGTWVRRKSSWFGQAVSWRNHPSLDLCSYF